MDSIAYECEVCAEKYNETNRAPLMLKECGHTYCKFCLGLFLAKTKNVIQCPKCRVNTEVSELSKLPKNFAMIELKKSIDSLNLDTNNVEKIQEDSKNENTIFINESSNNSELAKHQCFCDGCSQSPILGTRYRCGICPDFDFCANCKYSKEHLHPFWVMEEPDKAAYLEYLPHENIFCDNCKLSVFGKRFKCQECDDFDFCESCFNTIKHTHPFTELTYPDLYHSFKIWNFVTCDNCKTTPIIGNRYKCYTCPDFDLCERCVNNCNHPAHQFILQ